MQQAHVVDMRPAKAAGRSLFATNDPRAEPPRVDPKCDRADQRALAMQIRQQHAAEVRGYL